MTPEQAQAIARLGDLAGLPLGAACSLDGYDPLNGLFDGNPEPECSDDGLPDEDRFDVLRALDDVREYGR